MSTRLAVEHHTVYRYGRPVQLGPHLIRLRPAPHCRTPIVAYSLSVSGAEHLISWQQDPFGNHVARCVFQEDADELTVTVELVVDMVPYNPFDFLVDEPASTWPFRYDTSLVHDLAPYLNGNDTPAPLLEAWVEELAVGPTPTTQLLVDVNRRVLGEVDYAVRMEPGVQTPDETLARRSGSCRDSAWLLVRVLRTLGIAARFASGYLVQLVDDDRPYSPRRDGTDLHAWAEAYIPGAGWIGLDPTSGMLSGPGHIPLACTSSPASAAPITGSADAAEVEFAYSSTVRRIRESLRARLPYTPRDWQRIDELGRLVDAELQAGDVRLTMGGEPTFVSAAHADEPEWNTLPLGGCKRELAGALARRLAAAFAPGGLTHHGVGKWYPGEARPRWQIGVYWRADGQELWRDAGLLADPTVPGSAGITDAAAVMSAIADGLGLPEDVRYPAYEDPLARLLNEARLPAGPSPTPEPAGMPRADALGRAAIVAAIDADHGEPRGWALPLHRAPGDAAWSTGRWRLRRERLFLFPGDLPAGSRLPLDSLTWTRPAPDGEQSQFRDVHPLAEEPRPRATAMTHPPPATALCIESRDGHIHVFLPPIEEFAHVVELIASVEDAARATGVPVVLEGYPPPRDPRCRQLVVAPDPGVIEVNIHPSSSWAELTTRTTTLSREARAVGLTAEKFGHGGERLGTGGGCHLTLGGATPADSPMLRRPDLMRSLLTYWQHHPSLSYLFAGRFVGPTSQAPRIDEARHESLYELEIAFAELERLSGLAPPWLIDRVLRHLLIDVSGNTHRAEFCIDKLFDPDFEHGRLGVVELRAFEMPPHPQMALVQALLVRALLARFWAQPYTGPLVRWGTELHDRFMLPWWVETDICAVVDDLDRHGFTFELAWLRPFLEFRFPVLGVVDLQDVSVELRGAIEPWHVLGEEDGAGSTRSVDSSLERVQVRVDGLIEPRYAITCNGHVVPVQPTGTPGTYVGAVRFRVFRPWSGLHPTIGAHAPLTFEVVDRWSGRSLGGCRYHACHPGGLSWDRRPASDDEAESRRASRFEPIGHAPGPVELPEVRRGGEYPRTLDLRRPGPH